jgi:hypothetical protein
MAPDPRTNIDQIILSLATSQWQKLAMLVAKAMSECENESIEITHEMLAEHIESLVRQGKLESQGNLNLWRYSEVRLSLPAASKSG